MINSYEYYQENREECDAEWIAAKQLDEVIEYDADFIYNNQLPF